MVFQRRRTIALPPSSGRVPTSPRPHQHVLRTVLHRSRSGRELLQFEGCSPELSALTSLHQMAKLVVLICVSLRTDIVEHLFMGRLGWSFDRQLWINVSPEHLPILIGVNENGVSLI